MVSVVEGADDEAAEEDEDDRDGADDLPFNGTLRGSDEACRVVAMAVVVVDVVAGIAQRTREGYAVWVRLMISLCLNLHATRRCGIFAIGCSP